MRGALEKYLTRIERYFLIETVHKTVSRRVSLIRGVPRPIPNGKRTLEIEISLANAERESGRKKRDKESSVSLHG